ncbi:hypothetical protein SAMN05216604_101279 [Pseudomonas agarici]|nr:hypothetical protein SAMN05216604_101279 [Pseudomonas agarici]
MLQPNGTVVRSQIVKNFLGTRLLGDEIGTVPEPELQADRWAQNSRPQPLYTKYLTCAR